MKRFTTAILGFTLMVTPSLLLAQRRGTGTQQGTGQSNPDIQNTTPVEKSSQGTATSSPYEQGTAQSNPDTQQQSHRDNQSRKKDNRKTHGGSHDQAAPKS